MTTNELELYLLHNGFDMKIAPEVYKTLKEAKYVDLRDESANRLKIDNDYLRMDIRNVAEDITLERQAVAKSRGVSVKDLPYRIQG